MYYGKGYGFSSIEWYFRNWRYYIEAFVGVPSEISRMWEITIGATSVQIQCNGVQVLEYVYTSSSRVDCYRIFKDKTVSSIMLTSTDTASAFFSSDYICNK